MYEVGYQLGRSEGWTEGCEAGMQYVSLAWIVALALVRIARRRKRKR